MTMETPKAVGTRISTIFSVDDVVGSDLLRGLRALNVANKRVIYASVLVWEMFRHKMKWYDSREKENFTGTGNFPFRSHLPPIHKG